jgi:hypothetical protein
MSEFASVIPPNQSPPDPEIPRWLARLFAGLMCVLFSGLIFFIVIEFMCDMLGHRLDFSPTPPPKQNAAETNDTASINFSEQFELISPKDKTRTIGEDAVILVHWTEKDSRKMNPFSPFELWLDGYFVPWDMQYGKNTWFVNMPVVPGEHHLRTQAFESVFFVEESDDPAKQKGPADWKFFRRHPDTDKPDKCGTCHIIATGRQDVKTSRRSLTVGDWKGTDSCFDCHKRQEVNAIHEKHNQPADRCTDCHTIH